MTRAGRRLSLKPFSLGLFVLVASPSARANVSLYGDDILSVDLGLTVGGGLFQTRNTNFGADLDEPRKGTVANVDWREAFALPKLTAEVTPLGMGAFYGGLGYVFAATCGVGTPDGLTFNRPRRLSALSRSRCPCRYPPVAHASTHRPDGRVRDCATTEQSPPGRVSWGPA